MAWCSLHGHDPNAVILREVQRSRRIHQCSDKSGCCDYAQHDNGWYAQHDNGWGNYQP